MSALGLILIAFAIYVSYNSYYGYKTRLNPQQSFFDWFVWGESYPKDKNGNFVK